MRYKRLLVTWELIVNMLETGVHHKNSYEVSPGVPINTKLVNVRHSWPNVIELLLEHPSFPELKEGGEIPEVELTFTRVVPECV